MLFTYDLGIILRFEMRTLVSADSKLIGNLIRQAQLDKSNGIVRKKVPEALSRVV